MAFKLSVKLNGDKITTLSGRSFLKVFDNIRRMKKKRMNFGQYTRFHFEDLNLQYAKRHPTHFASFMKSSFPTDDIYFKHVLHKNNNYTQQLQQYDPADHQVHSPQQHPFYGSSLTLPVTSLISNCLALFLDVLIKSQVESHFTPLDLRTCLNITVWLALQLSIAPPPEHGHSWSTFHGHVWPTLHRLILFTFPSSLTVNSTLSLLVNCTSSFLVNSTSSLLINFPLSLLVNVTSRQRHFVISLQTAHSLKLFQIFRLSNRLFTLNFKPAKLVDNDAN